MFYRRRMGPAWSRSWSAQIPEIGVWVEITNLVIPTLNDDPGEVRRLADWVLEHLGPDVPVHFTAFHRVPAARPAAHAAGDLRAARSIAREAGLRYVYEGNVLGAGAHTSCASCGRLLIRRSWHAVLEDHLVDGRCPDCGQAVPGVWAMPFPKETRR